MNIDALAALALAGAQIGTGIAASSAASRQAGRAREQAALAAEDERRKGRRLAGKQRAGFGKAGVRIDEGTPLDVLAQTAADADLNAFRAAFAREQRADDLESAGRVELTRGLLGAGATILGQAETFRDLIRPKTSSSVVRRGPPVGSTSAAAIARASRIA